MSGSRKIGTHSGSFFFQYLADPSAGGKIRLRQNFFQKLKCPVKPVVQGFYMYFKSQPIGGNIL